jgi:hypothetical protein
VPDRAQLTRAAERLISGHIESVGALDLLLLLHDRRDRDWSLDELCRELRCPEGWAEGEIRRLDRLELLASVGEGRYRYRRGRRHGPAVDEIARACRRNRAEVTRLIFARSA